jgi:hypothetical protein
MSPSSLRMLLLCHIPPAAPTTMQTLSMMPHVYSYICPSRYLHVSAQPHPPKQQYNSGKEPHPNLPTNPRLLRHTQHAIHCALYLVSRVFELVIHLLGEGGRVANFVADQMRKL